MERLPTEVAEPIARSGYPRPGFAAHYDAYRPQPPRPWPISWPGSPGSRGRGWWSISAAGPASRPASGPTAPRKSSASSRTRRCAGRRRRARRCWGSARRCATGDGHAAATGLPDGAVDLVTCAQSFHWLEPTGTLAKVARILRPGGSSPSTIATSRRRSIGRWIGPGPTPSRALAWVRAATIPSGRRRGTSRCCGQAGTSGTRARPSSTPSRRATPRAIGLALSTGRVEQALASGASPEDLGLPTLREVADRVLGRDPHPWQIGYRIGLVIR